MGNNGRHRTGIATQQNSIVSKLTYVTQQTLSLKNYTCIVFSITVQFSLVAVTLELCSINILSKIRIITSHINFFEQ